MRNFIAISLMIGGVLFGLYAGIWWAFIGGIVDIVNAVKAPETEALDIALGVAKVVFAAPIGWLSFGVITGTGYAMVK